MGPALDSASRRFPDVLVHLKLEPNLEIVLQNPIDKLARFESIEHRGEQNRKPPSKMVFLDGIFGPGVVFASPNDEFDFVMRLKLVQIAIEIVLAFAAAGAFQVEDLDDLWVYRPDVQAPASFEQNGAARLNQAFHQRKDVLLQERLTPGHFNQWAVITRTVAMISSTVMSFPS